MGTDGVLRGLPALSGHIALLFLVKLRFLRSHCRNNSMKGKAVKPLDGRRKFTAVSMKEKGDSPKGEATVI